MRVRWSSSKVEVQFPHVSDALLEQLGYQKKNRYSSSSFKVRSDRHANSSILYAAKKMTPLLTKASLIIPCDGNAYY